MAKTLAQYMVESWTDAAELTPYLRNFENTSVVSDQKPLQQFVSETGAKRNSNGKTPYSYLPLDLLDGAAKVMEKGATVYGLNNFRAGFEPIDALNSLLRHVASLQSAIVFEDKDGSQGHLIDSDSTQAHIHHVLTSALILVDSMRKKGFKV